AAGGNHWLVPRSLRSAARRRRRAAPRLRDGYPGCGRLPRLAGGEPRWHEYIGRYRNRELQLVPAARQASAAYDRRSPRNRSAGVPPLSLRLHSRPACEQGSRRTEPDPEPGTAQAAYPGGRGENTGNGRGSRALHPAGLDSRRVRIRRLLEPAGEDAAPLLGGDTVPERVEQPYSCI